MAEPTVFKFSTAIVAIPFGVAALAVIVAVVCLFIRNKALGRTIAAVALLIAAVAGLVFGPSMLLDQVVVSGQHIEQRTGFAWSQTVKGFRFSDVSFVRITEKPTGAKGRISQVWEVHESSGNVRDIDPGDLWESNGEEIVRLLKSHGVQFR